MITPNTPTILSDKSQQGIVQLLKEYRKAQRSTIRLRELFRNIDLAYAREQDLSDTQVQAKMANRYGDASKFQNITVPVVMPQVESAVTYQSSVFLTGTPLFGVVSSAANMDAAMQMETIIDEQAIRGGWVNQLMLVFRDAFKYTFYAAECSWQSIALSTLETDATFSTTEARPKEIIWSGNVIKRLDPYNTLLDTRVIPSEMHKRGEFAGYTELMSRIELKSFIASLPNKMVANVVPAFESGIGDGAISGDAATAKYYVPRVNPEVSIASTGVNAPGSIDWAAWAGIAGAAQNIGYKSVYHVTTLYAKILPSEFVMRGVPGQNTPQIWKFIFVNDTVLIYAERQTNAHGYLPILCGQGTEDGLGYQTKSLARNAEPTQQLSSALWNSLIASRRRAISDRVIYDPSRISEAHINNANPIARIPVRPAAYGKNVQESVYAFPYRNDQDITILQAAAAVEAMANKTSRQNPVRQGQFVKGNKTRSEFEEVMGNANGADQMQAMAFECNLFTPLKEIIKINILQYQGSTILFNRAKEQEVTIDPIVLRKAVLEFKISDGLTPSDKIVSTDVIREGLLALANTPAIAAGYNLSPMFSYLMKLQGARISEFEKPAPQIAYEQAMGEWQQLVMQILKANPQATAANYPPQPLPEQFGYIPPQAQTAQAGQTQQTTEA